MGVGSQSTFRDQTIEVATPVNLDDYDDNTAGHFRKSDWAIAKSACVRHEFAIRSGQRSQATGFWRLLSVAAPISCGHSGPRSQFTFELSDRISECGCPMALTISVSFFATCRFWIFSSDQELRDFVTTVYWFRCDVHYRDNRW